VFVVGVDLSWMWCVSMIVVGPNWMVLLVMEQVSLNSYCVDLLG
jgi:hypothetical protein